MAMGTGSLYSTLTGTRASEAEAEAEELKRCLKSAMMRELSARSESRDSITGVRGLAVGTEEDRSGFRGASRRRE